MSQTGTSETFERFGPDMTFQAFQAFCAEQDRLLGEISKRRHEANALIKKSKQEGRAFLTAQRQRSEAATLDQQADLLMRERQANFVNWGAYAFDYIEFLAKGEELPLHRRALYA